MTETFFTFLELHLSVNGSVISSRRLRRDRVRRDTDITLGRCRLQENGLRLLSLPGGFGKTGVL